MPVFRVERNKGYTVMSNHHLRNKDLTLKAKGLLSQMLSLPETAITGNRLSVASLISFIIRIMPISWAKLNIPADLRLTMGFIFLGIVSHSGIYFSRSHAAQRRNSKGLSSPARCRAPSEDRPGCY